MEELLKEHRFEKMLEGLNHDSGINYRFSGSGHIYIERKLPFLLVYRSKEQERDVVIENLVKNEASFMVCSEKLFPSYRLLILKIVKRLSDEFGAFLLMEVWPRENSGVSNNYTAKFELYGPGTTLPETIDPLKENVRKMDLAGLAPEITLSITDRRCPDHLQPLLSKGELKRMQCLLLGLKVEPFYRSMTNGHIYPLLERKLYSGFAEVFRKSVYDFIKVQGNRKVSGFQSLARREVKPETWIIDKQLVDIDSQIQFLLLVSPVNSGMAWKEFKKNKFRKVPVFHYRMLPKDPELLKRSLYNIRIEEIEDPTLGFLFREKRSEIDKMLTMLKDRNTPEFLYGNLLLFSDIKPTLLSSAKEILNDFPVSDTAESEDREYYGAQEFAELVRQELLYLQKQWPGVSLRVDLKDSITDLMVNRGILSIPSKSKIPKNRAQSLIQHEVGTHVLTYYNGKNQPLQLLCSGVPGYEQLQEGIAVLAEYLTGGLSITRMQVLAARVIAVDSMIKEHGFIKTFQLLTDDYKFSPEKAFFITTRVYRGGGFVKDAVYLKGLIQLFQYLKDGHSLKPLLIGKIQQNYLSIIEELVQRKILKPVGIEPRYLTDSKSLERLADLKKMEKITDLINLRV